MNVILLGTIIKVMGLESITWDKIIRDQVKPQFTQVNLRAIEVGMGLVAL
jgi:indolepyruvate ferredoxin oxidoreductase beta subunit